MFRNYIKIAFRTFVKERFYAIINVLGLSLGIASSLLIGMYIMHETSYDDFHPDAELTYRVNMTAIWNPDGGVMGSSVIPLAESLKTEFPSITSTLRINTSGTQLINIEDEKGTIQAYSEENVLAVDSTFFEFFNIPLIEGDPRSAFIKKNSVVLTESMARKYFVDQPALGKSVLLGDSRIPLRVTGVSIDPPSNLHFDYDMLLSMHTNPSIKRFEWSWIWTQVVTYIKVDGDPKNLQDQMPAIAPKYAANAFKRLDIDFEEYQKEKGGINFYLQPIRDIHLYSDQIPNRIGVDGNITYIYVFGTIAIFILLLASINFMNLTTARASGRAKEIGVKKVLGSSKENLIYQFLSEALFMSLIATVVALGLVELAKIGLIGQFDIDFTKNIFTDWKLLLIVMILPVILGLLAGSYPAFYLTSFKSAQVLKGKLQSGMKHSGVRNTLVIFQFTIAIVLMTCSLIVFRQLEYFRTGDLGFDRDHVMIIHDAEKLGDQLESFNNELTQNSDIINSSLATIMPGTSMEDLFHDPNNPDTKVSLGAFKVDEAYIGMLNIPMAIGRNFSKDHLSDTQGIIINESAMRTFGWELENVIGKHVDYFEDSYEVIGVMKDFHNFSLQYNVTPVGFFHINSNMWLDSRLIAIKFKPENIKSLISQLEAKWSGITEVAPFNYSFLDENLARGYEAEEQIGRLFSMFTILALIIACIGLFGLASYISTQRSKEIGIRKVLGASTKGLVLLLNRESTKLVMISITLSIPVSLWMMSQWLEQFANKISISWNVFLLVGLGTLLIAWITVAFHSVKTAMLNPTEILKNE